MITSHAPSDFMIKSVQDNIKWYREQYPHVIGRQKEAPSLAEQAAEDHAKREQAKNNLSEEELK